MRRVLRSFVRRNRGMTPTRRNALALLSKDFGLNKTNNKFNFTDIFQNSNPVIIDIGFGNGEELIRQAQKNPQYNFIGMEVYLSGILNVYNKINEYSLQNIRVIEGDAKDALQSCISNCSIASVRILFPDPWPKKRHNKRRLIQNDFLQIIAKILTNTGTLCIATDCSDYAEHINKLITEFDRLAILDKTRFDAIYLSRTFTKYEQIGINKNNKISEFAYIKK